MTESHFLYVAYAYGCGFALFLVYLDRMIPFRQFRGPALSPGAVRHGRTLVEPENNASVAVARELVY